MLPIYLLSLKFEEKISKLNSVDTFLNELSKEQIIISFPGQSYPKFVFFDDVGKIDFWCYPYLGKSIHFNNIESMALFSCLVFLPGNYYGFLSSLIPEPARNSKYVMHWENIFN
jgi:hypothetical protein